MDKYIEPIFDINTGEITEREYTSEEIAEREKRAVELNIKNRLIETDLILNTARTLEEIYTNSLPNYKKDLFTERESLRKQLRDLQ